MALTGAQLLAFVKKNPISIGSGFLCLLLGAGIYYRGIDVPDLQTELETKTAEGERLAANLKHSAQLKEQFASVTTSAQAIDARIIRISKLGDNLKYFYKLEADTGTKLSSDPNQLLAPSNAKSGSKAFYTPVPYAVKVSGSYAQVIDFLRRVETGAHFARVLSTVVSGPPPSAVVGDKPDLVYLSLNLELLGLP